VDREIAGNAHVAAAAVLDLQPAVLVVRLQPGRAGELPLRVAQVRDKSAEVVQQQVQAQAGERTIGLPVAPLLWLIWRGVLLAFERAGWIM